MYIENDVAVSSTQQGFTKNETNLSFSLIKLLDYNNPGNAINNIIFYFYFIYFSFF